MKKAVCLIAVLAVVLAAAPAPSPSPHPAAAHKKSAAPKPTATPALKMPLIASVVSKPFCTALRNNIGPAVGAMIRNDAIVASTRPLFEDYLKYEADADTGAGMRDISLMRMENSVTPLVTSLADIDKFLNDTRAFRYPPHTADEKRLLELRDKLQAVEAMQKASLDVINGFVASEQLAAIQVEGNDVNTSINGDTTKMNNTLHPTPAPQFQEDPNVIGGLPQNPYTIDTAVIPGMSLGSNPIRHVIQGLQWTQAQTGTYEGVATKSVMQGVALCGGHGPAPAAAPPLPSAHP